MSSWPYEFVLTPYNILFTSNLVTNLKEIGRFELQDILVVKNDTWIDSNTFLF